MSKKGFKNSTLQYRFDNFMLLYVEKRRLWHFLSVFILLFLSCDRMPQKTGAQTPVMLNTETKNCTQDSSRLSTLISSLEPTLERQQQLVSFYRHRNYLPAWINASDVNENAGNFINILCNEKTYHINSPDSSLQLLQRLYKDVLADTNRTFCNNAKALEFEVNLTKSFFDYAHRNWQGADDRVLKELKWSMTRKQIDYAQLLTDYLSSKGEKSFTEPVYRQYGLLKNYLRKYTDIEQAGGWPQLSLNNKTLRNGDSSAVIRLIRRQLFLTGDLTSADSISLFDDSLTAGVKRFQKRHGLNSDGTINGATLNAMCVNVKERILQILINMERCRWVPIDVKGDYLVVNIPEFRLHVYENDRLDWSCNVIVGKSNAVNNTVIFNDSLSFIVFNPYWNIPNHILIKETLPAIKKDPAYLTHNDLEVVDNKGRSIATNSINWDNYSNHFPYIIRQKPGKNNSLGQVKFLFPNAYDIYMHDTPAKILFSETRRSFSHGCIRLEEPFRLTQFLLREDSAWTEKKINSIVSAGKETFVKLKKKVPVFITYFTCWVDRAGKLNFRDDIYGHDAEMKKILFVN